MEEGVAEFHIILCFERIANIYNPQKKRLDLHFILFTF